MSGNNTTGIIVFQGHHAMRPWDLWDIALLVLFLFGLLGNTLTIAVFRKKSMRHNNEALFLISMSFTDICLLSLKFFANIQKQYRLSIYHLCIPLHYILPQSFAYISPWLIVITTIERTYAVIKPLNVAYVFSRRVCFTIIMSGGAVFMLLSVTLGFCIEYAEKAPYYCRIKGLPQGRCYNYMATVFPWIKSALMSWIPSLVAFVLNSVIIVNLFKASKERQNISNVRSPSLVKQPQQLKAPDSSNAKRKSSTLMSIKSKEMQITFRLCVISIGFVILTLPYSTFDLLRKIGVDWKLLRSRNAQRAVLLLLDFLHATNFILYCLTGAKFRHELAKIFKFKCYQ